jgi:serine/threonine-protein kinase
MSEPSVSFYPLSVGETIGGKYRIDAVLGEGGMGVVFAATHVDLHCPVAIKVIRQELNQQPELIARLMLEARAAAQIKSEHVCRVLDVSRLEGGPPYVVMEYLDGKNLGTILEAKGRLNERLAVDYVLQACEAVAEAHRAGVIHRDLKPENLFLAEFPDGRRAIKVLDFGISKMTGPMVKAAGSSLTNPSSAMGSPHFMAPEQMTAARDVDARADIWALGTILHQLVTGQLAFDGDSLPAVCAAVLQGNPVPIRDYLAELSPGLEEAILRCLVKSRDQRLGTVAELAQLIAPFGSAQAAQSALRISRLSDNSYPSPNSEESSSGTLLSPRQLPTPRTPVQRVPIETVAAVTSSKRSFSGFRSAIGASRGQSLAAMGGLLLVVGLGVVVLNAMSRGPLPASSSKSDHSSPLSAANAAVVSVAPVAAQPAPSSAELQPAASASGVAPIIWVASETSASSQQASNAPVSPAQKSLALTAKVRAATVKNKTNSATDPYNSDNFGGRR